MPTIKMKVNGQWVYVDNGVNSQLTEALEEINDQLEAFALEEDTNLLQGGTYLGSGTDLWSITQVGNYYCHDSSAVMNMTHCPTTYAFSLRVTSGTGEKIAQEQTYKYLRYELKPFDVNNAYVYYADAKSTNGGASWTWSEWKKITEIEEADLNFATIEIGSTQPSDEIVPNNADTLNGFSLFDIMLKLYPVGAIYMSTISTSPATLFGGTWERIKDTFLLSAGDSYSAGSIGGEATHTLTINEMPSHKHSFHGLSGTVASGSNFSRPVNAESYTTDQAYQTSTRGGDQPHNNMPPYLTVYTWKRTA